MKMTLIASFVAAACLVSGSALANGAYAPTKHHVKTVALAANKPAAQAVINQNTVTNDVSTFNWNNRITVGGQANIDASWGNHAPIGSFHPSNDSTDINVNNANLIVDANVNPWVTAHLNLAYLGDQDRAALWPYTDKFGVRYGDSHLAVDEAFVRISNLARTPFWAQVGKGYIPFGTYDRYPAIVPLTQILSQTRATAITGGVVTDLGFYGSVYVFNGPTYKNVNADNRREIANYGAQVGYLGSLHNVGLADVSYNVNVGLIRNIYDVDSLAPLFVSPFADHSFGYRNYVGGLAAHIAFDGGPFSVWGNYVTALGKLDGFNFHAVNGHHSHGSKIWAADVNAAYSFQTMAHDSRFGVSYQCTGGFDNFIFMNSNSSDIFVSAMPERRYQASYMVNVWNKTDFSLTFAHDMSYKTDSHHSNLDRRHHDNDRLEANQLVARLSVRF